MTTLATQTQTALNMVEYWKGMRVGECALRSPEGCKLIDEQIAKYEAQAEHLRAWQPWQPMGIPSINLYPK